MNNLSESACRQINITYENVKKLNKVDCNIKKKQIKDSFVIKKNKNDIEGKLETTIAHNKTDIEGKLETCKTELETTIADNKTHIEVKLETDEPSTLLTYLIDPDGNVRRPTVPK